MDVDPLGEGAAVGVAQLGGDDAGRLLVGRHGRGRAWRSRWGWEASPTLAARRAKARLAWFGVTFVARSVRNAKSSWTGWGGRPGSTLRSVTVWGCPRGLARNQLGLSLRVAAINLRRLVTMGLDHGDAGWTLA